MSEFNISIPGGESRRLKTGGTYCPADILVAAQKGFIQPDDEYLTPEFVYATTRPAGWLPMPRPTDYECYCLGFIYPGITAHFNLTVTFSGTCVVEFGSLVDGVFVAKENYSPTSETFFTKTLRYEDYGDDLPDGTRQYMVRISGTKITRLNFLRNTTVPQGIIVDIICGIALYTCTTGNYNQELLSLNSLRYLNFVGKGCVSLVVNTNFVGGSNSLLSVGCEAKGTLKIANYCCAYARSLTAISPNLFAGVTENMEVAFLETNISYLKLGIAPKSARAFFKNSHLAKFTQETIDTRFSDDMSELFKSDYSLLSVTGLNLSSATNVSRMFDSCYVLLQLTFAGETTPGGWTISLTNTCLSHDALVEMIASLPVATNAATITITNNPGAAELTDEEIAVATAKNWTVTI